MKKDVDIREELNSILPGISWTDTECPFDVPQAYFEELHPRIIARIANESADLDALSTETDILQKHYEIPFEIPEKYFQQLSDSILSKTVGKHRQIQPTNVHSRKIIYFILSAAAALLLLIGLSRRNFFHRQVPQSNPTFAALSNQEIVDYLNYHMSLLDKEELINNMEAGSTISNLSTDISTSSLENYLDSADLTN